MIDISAKVSTMNILSVELEQIKIIVIRWFPPKNINQFHVGTLYTLEYICISTIIFTQLACNLVLLMTHTLIHDQTLCVMCGIFPYCIIWNAIIRNWLAGSSYYMIMICLLSPIFNATCFRHIHSTFDHINNIVFGCHFVLIGCFMEIRFSALYGERRRNDEFGNKENYCWLWLLVARHQQYIYVMFCYQWNQFQYCPLSWST